MDSTIFSKAEDVVAALKSGKIVKNDDKRVDFMIKKHYGNVGNDAQNWFKGFASALYDAGSQVFLCPQMMKIVA